MWSRSIPRLDRIKKKRRALDVTWDLPLTQSDVSSTPVRNIDWQPGACKPGLCGQEAACRQFHNNTYICVCPHDLSPPTSDFKCPNRLTVPLTPSPIHNIMLPSGGNTSTNTTASPTVRPTSVTLPEQTVLSTRDDFLPAWNGLVIGILAVTVTMLLVSITVCLWKRKELAKCVSRAGKSRKPSSSPSPQSLSKGLLVAERYEINPQYTLCTSGDPVRRLSRECICFLQEIGEGCFGKVYKGELRKVEGALPDIVAVKVLKESASREAEDDFMREVNIMSAFKHTNILELLGVVIRDPGSSPWMVFEFMPHGDLAEVLRSNSPELWKPVPGLLSLTKESLLRIALQIAAGMCYLASQRFVHRDLACRNCLVGVDLVVKIADFGMSRDVYTCDYYTIGGSRLLPVRWMSPESIRYGRFTLESDVWSYGVILWEIYSLGKQPYYGHSNEEAVNLILQGIMLIPPEDCPTLICDLMRSCWKTEPWDRIKFTEITHRLGEAGEAKVDAANAPPRIPSNPPPIKAPSLSRVGLPRPPVNFPGAEFSSDQDVELLDPDNYLLPQIPPASRCEYLQTLPD